MVTHVFYNDDCEFQVEENATLLSPTKGNESPLTARGTSRLKRVEVNIFGFRATTRASCLCPPEFLPAFLLLFNSLCYQPTPHLPLTRAPRNYNRTAF
jgi:hypothetical protein